MRARSLQLRFHDRASPRRSSRCTRWMASSLTVGPGPACVTASTAGKTFALSPGWSCLAPRIHTIRRAANTSSGTKSASSSCGGYGMPVSRRSIPTPSYIANAGGGALSELDMKTIGELAPTFFADRQARRGLMPPWVNGKNGKEYRATLGTKAIAGIFSVGLEEEYRWKDSVQSERRNPAVGGRWDRAGSASLVHEIQRQARSTAGGCRSSSRSTTGTTTMNAICATKRIWRDVAMVYSQQTATFYGGDEGARQS